MLKQGLVLFFYFNLASSYTTDENFVMQNSTTQLEDVEPISTSLWENKTYVNLVNITS